MTNSGDRKNERTGEGVKTREQIKADLFKAIDAKDADEIRRIIGDDPTLIREYAELPVRGDFLEGDIGQLAEWTIETQEMTDFIARNRNIARDIFIQGLKKVEPEPPPTAPPAPFPSTAPPTSSPFFTNQKSTSTDKNNGSTLDPGDAKNTSGPKK